MMTAMRLVRLMCAFSLVVPGVVYGQLAAATPDTLEVPVDLGPAPSANTPPDADAMDRINAQIERWGGRPSEDIKQAMLRSLQQQQQIYGSQIGTNIPPKGQPVWRSLGPNSAQYETNGVTQKVTDSGRVATILQSGTDEDTVYVLTSGGGLWKTTTFTHTNPQWVPLTDSLLTTSGGSVAFGKSESTLYLGLGDPFDFAPHLGGYMTRSDDGGKTWTALVSLTGAGEVRDLKVDTSGTEIVLAATDVGLFRSTDRGATFAKVANVVGQGFWSIVRTSAGWLARSGPSDPNTVAAGQTFVSTDKGATWTATGAGLTGAGRATLAVATPGDSVVFAYAATPNGLAQKDLFRSDNGGLSWTALNITGKTPTNPNLFQSNMDLMGGQAWYNQLLLVDPADQTHRTIYVGGQLATAKTVDGGATWTLISSWLPYGNAAGMPYVHADCHTATMGSVRGVPTLMFGTDGGLFISKDAGASFDFSKNDGIVSMLTQTVASSAKNPQSVVSGLQDNGTRARLGASDVFNQYFGGDGEGVGWSQANNDITMGSFPGALFSTTGLEPNTTKWSLVSYHAFGGYFFTPVTTPSAALDPTGKFFFSALPIGVIYTWDGGKSWYYLARIGPGRRLPPGFTFRESWNFMALNTGPDGIAIAGTAGRLAVSMDYVHYTVQKILCPAVHCVPGFQGYISSPIWAPNNVIYVASESPIPGSVRVVRSTDLGVTWTAAGTGLPDAPVFSLAADMRDVSGSTIYAGTNMGVYVTRDGGASWTLFGAGMPTTQVTSLFMDPSGSVLRAATTGRGLWEVNP